MENYVVTVDYNSAGTDEVIVKAALRHSVDFDVVKELKDRFRARIRVTPEIEIVSADENRRTMRIDTNRKPIKFIDNRKQQS